MPTLLRCYTCLYKLNEPMLILNKHLKRSIPQKFVIALLLFFSTIFASSASIDNVRFEHYSIEQGLSQQTITAIFQDSKGFMWFGTQEGLNRFDGRTFKSFTPSFENPNSIVSLWVTSITEDSFGNLWIGTQDGLSKYNPELDTFTNFKADGSDSSINHPLVRQVWLDKRGNIWATTRLGLNKYLPQEKRFKPYNLNSANGTGVDIYAVAEDIGGGLWLGSDNHGLYRFDPSNDSFTRVVNSFSSDESSQGAIRSLYIDKTQRLWIGTLKSGTFTLDLKQEKSRSTDSVVTILPGMDKINSLSITQDTQGVMWFGGPSGLAYLADDERLNLITHSEMDRNSLSDSDIYSIYQDRSDVIWVGTFKGLNRWNKATTQFDHYRVSGIENSSLSGNIITSISRFDEQSALVSNLKGLDRIHLMTGEITPLAIPGATQENIGSYRVMSSAVVSESEVWLGTQSEGLIKYNTTNDTYVHYRPDPSSDNKESLLHSAGITAIHIDAQNTVWIATFGGGLSRYNRETDDFTTYLKSADDIYTMSSNNIMTISQTRDGNLWLGTLDGGISVFNPLTESVLRIQTNPQNQTSLSANLVWTIHEDSANNIWVGTHGGGVNLLTSHNREKGDLMFQRLGKSQGLPSDVVFGILEDEFENLWVSSNRGLSKLDREFLSFTNFSYDQGLQGTEFNSGSYAKMADGRMLFGGSNGVTAFYPSNVSLNQHLPETVISGFQRLDKVTSIDQQLDSSGRLIVDYTDYLIGFEFIGLHFAAPEKNQYKYRLLGFNDEWLKVRDVPRAVYTNLPAGNYIFEVIAANGDGLWNYDPTSVSFTVKPAPWRTGIAYAFYGLLVLFALYTIYRYQQRKLVADTKYRKALEGEVEKRTQELSQANQDLLKASITDQLTGLFNRRYLFDMIPDKSKEIFDKFSAAMARGQVNHETGPRLFFLMFDLDGFKPINDNYGHDAGDQMIQQVATLLKEVCRINDIVIRWGGDEFLVVGEVNKVEELAALAERIRERISKHGFNIGLSQKMYLSSSIGFALYPFNHDFPDALSWEQVHIMADNALYRSKDAGKNTWTGILECESPVPIVVMNALALNIDDAVDKNYVRVIKH